MAVTAEEMTAIVEKKGPEQAAREIAETLKPWIADGRFFLGEPQVTLPMETASA
jgi:uncharacterized protein (DUF39 family)